MIGKAYVLDGSSVAERFIAELGRLDAQDFVALRRVVSRSLSSAAGEIAWWHATISLGRLLARSGRTHVAHVAAVQARHAVVAAAEAYSDGAQFDRDDVVRIARSAGEAVEALIAPPGPHLVTLLEPWRTVLARSRNQARTNVRPHAA